LKLTKPQTAERLRAVQEIYFSNFGRLTTEALDSNKHLTATDAYSVVSNLAQKLQHYPDRHKLTDDAFCRWAMNVMEASIFICALITEAKPFVYRAILKVLVVCDDLGVNDGTKDEIASDVWMWALHHIDELMKPGTSNSADRRPAKLTTRMSELARWQARQWRTNQLRAKAEYAPLDDVEAAQSIHLYGGRQTRAATIEY
jgi:hypothetical protein